MALAQQVTKRVRGAQYALLFLNFERTFWLFGKSNWTGWCSCGLTYKSHTKQGIIQEAVSHLDPDLNECPFEAMYRELRTGHKTAVNQTANLPF